jgi:2-phospho-L-lactate guanylyltransferase (CobY/MobA/RfbA family)
MVFGIKDTFLTCLAQKGYSKLHESYHENSYFKHVQSARKNINRYRYN